MREPELMDGLGALSEMLRLHVDALPETWDLLQLFADQEQVDITEALRRLVARGALTRCGTVSSPVGISPVSTDPRVLLVSIPVSRCQPRYKWMSLFQRRPMHVERVEVSQGDCLTDRRLIVERAAVA